jgi:8-oxo-dGTP diphosphatase
MKQVTSCYLRRGRQVLLGLKKRGFGAGYFVGIGGSLEAAETASQAAVREIMEEVGVQVAEADLIDMGNVIFQFPARPEWNLDVALYQTQRWQGEIVASNEMDPAWFQPEEIPYDRMWQDARYWLPHLLDGIRMQARIVYHQDNHTVNEVLLKLLEASVS